MTREIVVLGDGSDHGGTVVSASAKFSIKGIQACVHGDQHDCPIPGHGTTAISSDSATTSGGKPVLRFGDKAGCGAGITPPARKVTTT